MPVHPGLFICATLLALILPARAQSAADEWRSPASLRDTGGEVIRVRPVPAAAYGERKRDAR